MSSKVTAQELKNIRSSYEMAIRDYSACINAKELEYWANCAERSIDQHVQTLDRGVSKQNQALLKEVGEAHQRLQLKLDAQHQTETDDIFQLDLAEILAVRQELAKVSASEPSRDLVTVGAAEQPAESEVIAYRRLAYQECVDTTTKILHQI